MRTYIIQTRPRTGNLNNLQTTHHTLQTTRIQPLFLQRSLQICFPRFLEAESSVAGLVEAANERDVEVRDVGADTEVDVCEGPWVVHFELDGAAGYGPGGAVGGVEGFGDVCAWGGLLVWFIYMEFGEVD